MSQIPAFASILLVGLLPACAAALGLGDIQPRSFLNQPLSAEIPVISDDPAEISTLNVRLAAAETFAQYGLSRPAMLGDLRFSVEPDPRGGTIRVTSDQPISEPFVTMLVEVSWGQGRLLREYTILLDPPTFAASAVRQPPAVEEPAPASQPAAPIANSAEPVADSRSEEPSTDGAAGTGRVHTVAPNETLWGIAAQYRPSRATDMNRAMMSIYGANPEAFGGNINRLRSGAVLRIPDAADMQRLGRGEANAEVRRQNQEWRGERPAPAESAARLELVPPPEAPKAAPAAATTPAPAGTGDLQGQIAEARRLLAVKDAELKALRDQVESLERQAAVLPEATVPLAEGETVAAPVAEKPAPSASKPKEKTTPAVRRQPERPPAQEGGGILGVIGSILTSIWFWLAAAAVLVGAALLARRRTAEEPVAWQPPPPPVERAVAAAAVGGRGEHDMIVIEEPARATGAFDRRAQPPPVEVKEEESPLERTISTEGSVNLDQDDPLAEADFHMAYGLYDQAADLLTAALGRDPGRRDIHLKLLDVYFVWENREGFLKQARSLREKIGGEDDPDWVRVVIMGRQLCGNDPLFVGGAEQAAVDMDLGPTGGTGGAIDFNIGTEDGRLDLDLSGDLRTGTDDAASTRVTLPSWAIGQTQELPTIETPTVEASRMASTMEAPTVEASRVATTMETPTLQATRVSSTMETPTIEARYADRTVETPTLSTAKLQVPGAIDQQADRTAEIDVEDLGLDLSGLDAVARDMATGLQEAMPEESALVDLDLSAADLVGEGDESTAEMTRPPALDHITNAMSKKEATGRMKALSADETAEQPGIANSMITRGLDDATRELERIRADLETQESAAPGPDTSATEPRRFARRGPGDQTMTEVGTKLDLARAYLDMGDPDGARSILNEVIEEGELPQQQEARQLLDGIND